MQIKQDTLCYVINGWLLRAKTNWSLVLLNDRYGSFAGASRYLLSVRSWPKIASHPSNLSVCFGEIAWLFRGRFVKFGFCCIRQQ